MTQPPLLLDWLSRASCPRKFNSSAMEFLNNQFSVNGWSFVVINAYHVAYAVENIYQGYSCQEPESSFWDFFFPRKETCLPVAEILKQNGAYLLSTIGLNILMMFLAYLVTVVCSAGARAKDNIWKYLVEKYKEFMLCKYCRCRSDGGCITKLYGTPRPLWYPKGRQKRSFANFPRRLYAMKMFALVIRSCVRLDRMEKDPGFEDRAVLDNYIHEEIVLFPKCVQDLIEYWYPLPLE